MARTNGSPRSPQSTSAVPPPQRAWFAFRTRQRTQVYTDMKAQTRVSKRGLAIQPYSCCGDYRESSVETQELGRRDIPAYAVGWHGELGRVEAMRPRKIVCGRSGKKSMVHIIEGRWLGDILATSRTHERILLPSAQDTPRPLSEDMLQPSDRHMTTRNRSICGAMWGVEQNSMKSG